jgi:signal transduction histidine kinase
MSFFAITGLVNGITSTILGLFIYLRNRKGDTNKAFTRFSIAVAVWSYCYFLWQISDNPREALFWARGLMMGSIFIPILFFHFVIIFLDIVQEQKKILIVGCILTLIFFISNFTPFFVNRVERSLSFLYWPKPGILFHLFQFIMFMGYPLYWWYLLIDGRRKSSGTRKVQISYVLMGSAIGFIGGATNHLLWYNIPSPPYWNLLPAIGFSFIAYGVVKYHLMNIRVILTEALVIATGLTLLIEAITAETLLLKVLGGALFGVFAVFGYQLVRSVIREIQLRTELEKAYAELEKLDKAKTEFLSIASHQLRTPLTAIKGYISMILEKTYGKIPGKMQKPLENVFASNQRLVKLVNDLLDISRIETGKMELKREKVSLDEMIESVIYELKVKSDEKKLYLKYEKPKTTLPEISLDKDKVRHIILNLIDNAIKYTEKGGITVRAEVSNSDIRVAVQDTGAGLEPEEAEKIFGVMTRGKAGLRLWTEGAGLGLHIARSFAALHDGRVWAESEGIGKGSTFYFELPIKK